MHGSVMSMVAAAFMGLLFIVELNVFMSSNLVTKVAMDNNMASQLRVNFNITVHDLHCASLRASRPLAARAPSLVSSARPRAHGSRLAALARCLAVSQATSSRSTCTTRSAPR